LLILHKKQEELRLTGTLPDLNKYKFKNILYKTHKIKAENNFRIIQNIRITMIFITPSIISGITSCLKST